jgi:hypothetical protein
VAANRGRMPFKVGEDRIFAYPGELEKYVEVSPGKGN